MVLSDLFIRQEQIIVHLCLFLAREIMSAFGVRAVSAIAPFYPYRSLEHKTRIE